MDASTAPPVKVEEQGVAAPTAIPTNSTTMPAAPVPTSVAPTAPKAEDSSDVDMDLTDEEENPSQAFQIKPGPIADVKPPTQPKAEPSDLPNPTFASAPHAPHPVAAAAPATLNGKSAHLRETKPEPTSELSTDSDDDGPRAPGHARKASGAAHAMALDENDSDAAPSAAAGAAGLDSPADSRATSREGSHVDTAAEEGAVKRPRFVLKKQASRPSLLKEAISAAEADPDLYGLRRSVSSSAAVPMPASVHRLPAHRPKCPEALDVRLRMGNVDADTARSSSLLDSASLPLKGRAPKKLVSAERLPRSLVPGLGALTLDFTVAFARSMPTRTRARTRTAIAWWPDRRARVRRLASPRRKVSRTTVLTWRSD